MKTSLQNIALASFLTISTLTGGYFGKQSENYFWEREAQKIARIENQEDREFKVKMHNYNKNNKTNRLERNIVFGGLGALIGFVSALGAVYLLSKIPDKD